MFPTANYSLFEQDDRSMTVDYSNRPNEKRTTYISSRGTVKKNDFSSKKSYLDVSIADELVVRISNLYSELYDEINYSKYIVDLKDDWDGEGSVGYKVSMWSSVVKFLVDYARWIFLQTGKVLYRPNIYNGKGGGIDVLWDEHKFQMLFRIDSEASNVVFYADDKNGQTSEGVFFIENVNFFMIPMPVSPDSV
jgi:hypothetical protein